MLSGCLQMMVMQTAQSRHKMTQGTTTAASPASNAVRQFARTTHNTVIRTAEGRTEKLEVESKDS